LVNHLSILGSTGSIGRQSLDAAAHLGIPVRAIAANSNTNLMEQQVRQFLPRLAAVYDEAAAKRLRLAVADTPTKVVCGMDGLIEAAAAPDTDCVVTAVSGSVGLRPTLAAIDCGKRIALANKETLVCAGALVMERVAQRGAEVIPVDSEHSAIFQSLGGRLRHPELKRILLTASGGPFRGMRREEVYDKTPAQAVAHPNWNMGAKITVDSASMFNKALEIVEARWLFDAKPSQIEVLIHPQSIVHSMVLFRDGAVLAQLGAPDMRVPIAYAMAYPERIVTNAPVADFAAIGQCTFTAPDTTRFPAIRIAYETLKAGGAASCMMNAANEEANAHFRAGKMRFTDIARVVEQTLFRAGTLPADTLEQVYFADETARRMAREEMEKLK